MYTVDLPGQIDIRHIRKESSITTVADYSTGYITDVSSTTVTGDSDALWTSANSNNMLLKVSGKNEVYRVTWVGATELTLDRSWVETAISSTDTSYVLYQDRYALASNYDRMALDPNRSVYYWDAGTKIYLTYKDPDEFEELQTYTVGDPQYYTIKWINGDPYLFIDPPTTDARTIYYIYIPSLARMTEYTTGTITTLANGGTAVTGSSTDFDGFVTDTTAYDYYFRIDDDGTGSSSVWYKISSADSDTGITLADTYGGTAIATGTETYTIATISLLPAGLDLAILYGAAIVSAIDQGNNTQADRWGVLYGKIVDQYKSIESKKDYGQQRVRSVYELPGARR